MEKRHIDIENIGAKEIQNFVNIYQLQDEYSRGEDFEWYFRLGMLYERIKRLEE